jgi:hypothetical protein
MPASHAATSRIHESLNVALTRKRVVRWYSQRRVGLRVPW